MPHPVRSHAEVLAFAVYNDRPYRPEPRDLPVADARLALAGIAIERHPATRRPSCAHTRTARGRPIAKCVLAMLAHEPAIHCAAARRAASARFSDPDTISPAARDHFAPDPAAPPAWSTISSTYRASPAARSGCTKRRSVRSCIVHSAPRPCARGSRSGAPYRRGLPEERLGGNRLMRMIQCFPTWSTTPSVTAVATSSSR